MLIDGEVTVKLPFCRAREAAGISRIAGALYNHDHQMSKRNRGRKNPKMPQLRPQKALDQENYNQPKPSTLTVESPSGRPNFLLRTLAAHPVFTTIAGVSSIIGVALGLYPILWPLPAPVEPPKPAPALFIHKFTVYDDLSGTYPHVGLEFTATNSRTSPLTLGPCVVTAFYKPTEREIKADSYFITDLSTSALKYPPRTIDDEFVTVQPSETHRLHMTFDGFPMSIYEREQFASLVPSLPHQNVFTSARLSCGDEKRILHSSPDFTTEHTYSSSPSKGFHGPGAFSVTYFRTNEGFRPNWIIRKYDVLLPIREKGRSH